MSGQSRLADFISALGADIKILYAAPVTVTTATTGVLAPVGSRPRNSFFVTGLSANANVAAPSGTPADGNTLMIRIVDNGTVRSLTWDAVFVAGANVTMPTVTTLGKRTYVYAIYNGSTWDVLSAGASG